MAAKVFGFMPVASWSWWWVVSPLWIGFSVTVVVPVIVLIGILVYAMFTGEPKPKSLKFRDRKYGLWR